MKRLLQAMMWVALMCVVASCANKGKLLTPSQMQVQQEKKAKRAQTKANKKAQQEEEDDADTDQANDKAIEVPAPSMAASATGKK